ncbi:MAG: toll/interleukin-1 receptor domain-containing protein [Polyangiaceae bacterium]
MATVWLIDESGRGGLNDVIGQLEEFAHQFGVNLRVEKKAASEFHELLAQPADVVVVHQNPDASLLSEAAPACFAHGCAVLPVVEAADDAKKLRPYLKAKNALIRGANPSAFASRLFDEVLTLAALLRPIRKVFISYQRSATLAAAHQLADELQALGFEAFLDERSIPAATDVDAEIGYRLNDVDLVILLATSQLHLSEWVAKEIEFCHNAKIGIFAVNCDSSSVSELFRFIHDDQVLTLNHDIIDPSDGFSAQDLPRVLERVREERVSGIARRVADLLPAAADQLESRYPGKVRGGDKLGEIQVDQIAGVTQVVPFRPTPEVLWELRQRHQDQRLDVIHPESVPADPRVVALEWLMLPVELGMEVHRVQKLWI